MIPTDFIACLFNGNSEDKRYDFPEAVQLVKLNDWTLTDKGIYFIYRYENPKKIAAHPAIEFFDFTTERVTPIAPLPKDPIVETGLSVSPDGKWLYYSIDDALNSDIMLVENFL